MLFSSVSKMKAIWIFIGMKNYGHLNKLHTLKLNADNNNWRELVLTQKCGNIRFDGIIYDKIKWYLCKKKKKFNGMERMRYILRNI